MSRCLDKRACVVVGSSAGMGVEVKADEQADQRVFSMALCPLAAGDGAASPGCVDHPAASDRCVAVAVAEPELPATVVALHRVAHHGVLPNVGAGRTGSGAEEAVEAGTVEVPAVSVRIEQEFAALQLV